MNCTYVRRIMTASIAIGASLVWQSVSAANWFPYKAEAFEPAFAADGKRS